MSRRMALALALYPRAWRERYGTEVSELTAELVQTAQVTPLRAGLDLLAGAARERRRALVRSRRPLAAAAAALSLVALAAAYQPRGGGDMHPYFWGRPIGIVLLMVWMCWLLVELFEGLYLRQERAWRPAQTAAGDRRRMQAWLIGPAVSALINVGIYLGPATFPGAAIRPGAVAAGAGLAVILTGMGLRLWSFTALGRYGTYAIVVSPDQPVVSRGPYRLLRHPAYAGAMLICVGFGLTTANWAVLAVATVLPLALVVSRIRAEEGALVRTLGEAYGSYAAGHRRLVPLVW
jgi:protein-S-isoprenylcysteine O-methyltransferase Ste14